MRTTTTMIAALAAAALAAGCRAPAATVAPAPSPDFTTTQAARFVAPGAGVSDATAPLLPVEVVHFDHDSARLDPVDRAQVRGAVDWLAANPDHRLVIAGHTDAVGPAAYNRELAAARARAVRDALVDAGAPPARLTLLAYGEAAPTPGPDATNRRVVVLGAPDHPALLTASRP